MVISPSSTASVNTALELSNALSAVSKSRPLSINLRPQALIRGREMAESCEVPKAGGMFSQARLCRS